MRGLRGRCPNCGQGNLFRAFLKVADACPACAEELHHHRADDLPAYLVIVVVGHVIVSLVQAVEVAYAPPLWLHMAIWMPATLLLALALIQPLKGLVVALQWRLGMHGFETARRLRSGA
jgi:uncharacterized protein (DUF983 family)